MANQGAEGVDAHFCVAKSRAERDLKTTESTFGHEKRRMAGVGRPQNANQVVMRVPFIEGWMSHWKWYFPFSGAVTS
jgi:hypothetical protein